MFFCVQTLDVQVIFGIKLCKSSAVFSNRIHISYKLPQFILIYIYIPVIPWPDDFFFLLQTLDLWSCIWIKLCKSSSVFSNIIHVSYKLPQTLGVDFIKAYHKFHSLTHLILIPQQWTNLCVILVLFEQRLFKTINQLVFNVLFNFFIFFLSMHYSFTFGNMILMSCLLISCV